MSHSVRHPAPECHALRVCDWNDEIRVIKNQAGFRGPANWFRVNVKVHYSILTLIVRPEARGQSPGDCFPGHYTLNSKNGKTPYGRSGL